MSDVRGDRPPTGEAPGGMQEPRTRMKAVRRSSLNRSVSCHRRMNFVACRAHPESPYAEQHVRWCGRTVGVTPPPTQWLIIAHFDVRKYIDIAQESAYLQTIHLAKRGFLMLHPMFHFFLFF